MAYRGAEMAKQVQLRVWFLDRANNVKNVTYTINERDTRNACEKAFKMGIITYDNVAIPRHRILEIEID